MKTTIFLLYLLLFPYFVEAQYYKKPYFIDYPTENKVLDFFQDAQGIIWACTGNGLFQYNGSYMQHCMSDNSLRRNIYYAAPKDSLSFYLSTANGLYIFNTRTYASELVTSTQALNVRTLLRIDATHLLLRTYSGAWIYDETTRDIQLIPFTKEMHINSIQRIDDTRYIICSDAVIFLYDYRNQCLISRVDALNLFSHVTCVETDPFRQQVWMGTPSGLFTFSTTEGRLTKVAELAACSVKKIRIASDHRLWIGTDNGLYIYTPELHTADYCTHQPLTQGSLGSHIINCFFEDREHNLWIGTEQGVSLLRATPRYDLRYWTEFYHEGKGNGINCLLKDTLGRLWMGGDNGVAYIKGDTLSPWYRTDTPQHRISHNRIRTIYQDREGMIWLASDGSISRYDEGRKEFINYLLMPPDLSKNSAWAYDIKEDRKGRLWVSTYLSGIFIIEKEKLLKCAGGSIVADHHLMTPELSITNGIFFDANDNAWVTSYREGVFSISPDLHIRCTLSIPDLGNAYQYQNAIQDHEGNLWIGSYGGIMYVDIHALSAQWIADREISRDEICSPLLDMGQKILCTSGKKNLLLSKKEKRTVSVLTDEHIYRCALINGATIYVAGNDFVISADTTAFRAHKTEKLIFTQLVIGGEPIFPGIDYPDKTTLKEDLNYTSTLLLSHHVHDFDIRVARSTPTLSMTEEVYEYQLKGLDTHWSTLGSLSHPIQYRNLSYGNYELLLRRYGSQEVVKRLSIHIAAPWYASWWMKLIYTCVLAFFLRSLYISTILKQKLKLARMERQHALESAQSKIDYMTQVSHDLKSPLTLILSSSSRLLQAVKGDNLQQAQTIYRTTIRIINTIRQSLQYNVDNGHLVHYSRIELVELVRSIVQHFSAHATLRRQSLTLHTSCDSLVIQTDVFKVESIVQNLLSNALQYTPEGGSITVTVTENGGMVELTVQDTGIGIPPEEQDLIFRRYYRSPKSQSIYPDGTGIGLSTVKEYVESLQGRIAFHSTAGQGTQFTVSFPLNETLIDVEEKKAEKQATSSCKLLIVDDDMETANYLFDSLSPYYICHVCHNGQTGFEYALAERPSLIITDIIMPVMNGFDFIKKLKENVYTSQIPVIVLSADEDHLSEQTAIDLGTEAFIYKPFDVRLLLSRIHQLLQYEVRRNQKERQREVTEHIDITTEENPDEKFLTLIHQIIEDHIQNDTFNVSRLSELSGIGTKQIYRRLKSLTGLTTVEYIKQVRLKKAAVLLQQSKFSISEILYMVGFNNKSYFSRSFQEFYGKTPKEYRDTFAATHEP